MPSRASGLWLVASLAPAGSSRLPPGHARSAAVRASRSQRSLCRWSIVRPLIEGTVARGQLRADRELYTGLDAAGQFVSDLPTPVTRELLERGQSRFNAFCSPCHGRRGDGRGMVVQRGLQTAPVVSSGPAAGYPGGLLLRRHQQGVLARCRAMRPSSLRGIAGPSSPTSVPCRSAAIPVGRGSHR